MLHLLRNSHFLLVLHLWNSDDLVPWNAVVLLDCLDRHGVSESLLRAFLGPDMVILLLHKIILRLDIMMHVWSLNILSFDVLDDSSILLQKLSWWQVLSDNKASIGTT